MEKVKIVIAGREHTVVTDESPNYIKALARRLNKHIELVHASNSNSTSTAVTSLVALSYLDELEKSAAAIEELKSKNLALSDRVEALTEELARAEAQIKTLSGGAEDEEDSFKFDDAQMRLG